MRPIEQLERRHPDLLFTESEASGLFYATCEEKRISIIAQKDDGPAQVITLDVGQAYAVAKELKDMLWMIGRKKPIHFKPGRPRKYERRLQQNVCEG